MDDEPQTKTQTVTSNTAPWAPQQAPLQQSFKDATKLYNSGGLNLQYYPGQTRAGLAPETTQAWTNIANRAQAGSPELQGASNYVQGILSGNDTGLLNPAIDRIRSAVNANYSAAGRYGSGSHDRAVGDAVGNLIFDRQQQAAAMAPGLAQAGYYDADRLAQVGDARQQYAQNQINDQIERFNWNQQSPANAIALYQSLIGGGYGGSTQGTQPVTYQSQGNPYLQGAGIAAQLAGSIFGGG